MAVWEGRKSGKLKCCFDPNWANHSHVITKYGSLISQFYKPRESYAEKERDGYTLMIKCFFELHKKKKNIASTLFWS